MAWSPRPGQKNDVTRRAQDPGRARFRRYLPPQTGVPRLRWHPAPQSGRAVPASMSPATSASSPWSSSMAWSSSVTSRGTDPGSRGAPLIRFISAARQLIDGLAALHAAGRLHRDVKPPNCLGGQGRAGGAARFRFHDPVRWPHLGGRTIRNSRRSLAYIAPEVLWGEPVTPASDSVQRRRRASTKHSAASYRSTARASPLARRASTTRAARPRGPDSLAELITSPPRHRSAPAP